MKKAAVFLAPLVLLALLGYFKDSSAPTHGNIALAESIQESSTEPIEPAVDHSVPPGRVLEIASSFANESRYADAIRLAEAIPVGSTYDSRSAQLKDLWASIILERARNKVQEGQETKAAAMLKAIPQNSSSYLAAAQLLKTTQR